MSLDKGDIPRRVGAMEYELKALFLIADAAQWTTIALDGLRHAYDATQETVPERRCECGQPFYLGRCVRCWARKELGVRR